MQATDVRIVDPLDADLDAELEAYQHYLDTLSPDERAKESEKQMAEYNQLKEEIQSDLGRTVTKAA